MNNPSSGSELGALGSLIGSRAPSVDAGQVNEIARGGESANQEAAFNIDDQIKLVADAKRYRWLRDVAWATPRQDLVPRDRHLNMLIKQDLDGEIDRAMKAYSDGRPLLRC